MAGKEVGDTWAISMQTSVTLVTARIKAVACINLSGNSKSTSSTPVHSRLLVHPSLLHFFIMVWYVQKIEHVIRNYTRWWLEQRIDTGENIEQLCVEFACEDALFQNMHAIFNHAVSHVTKSIEAYKE